MDYDVIVAGAGPTGLMLAHELRLHGVSVLLVDKQPGRTGESRALNLHPRTAEILDLRGILTHMGERSAARLESTSFAHLDVTLTFDGWGSRYPYGIGIPQAEVEEILEKQVTALGLNVQWNREVSAVEQDLSEVRVNVGDRWVRARYLVGCDGGRSTVRQLLDVPFPGLDARWHGTVADVAIAAVADDVKTVWDSVGNPRPRADGSFANMFPIDAENTFRIFYSSNDHPITDPRAEVPDREVLEVIREFYGKDTVVDRVRWASRFSDSSRQVEHYRSGRVLLAGDAAHVHLPLGGQGLSLGMQDAMNLGWKLAADITGWAPSGLLDTYHAERHPVGAAVLANTRAQVALSQRDEEHEALRTVFTELLALPEARRHMAGVMSGLGVKYDLGDDHHEAIGNRFRDFQGEDGLWASSYFHTGRGVLLATDSELLRVAQAWSDRVVAVRVPKLPYPGTTAILVRPDGYICWTPDGALEMALTKWFGLAG